MLQAGYLLQQGAIQPLENGRLHIDAERVESASHELYRKLITYQSLGQRDEFLAFGNSVISSIPQSIDAQILKAQGEYRPYFIDHQVDFLNAFKP